MNARDLITATDDTLVPMRWIRENLFPEIPRETRELFLAVEVAADFWAARFLGVVPDLWTRGGGGARPGGVTTATLREMARRTKKQWSYNAGLRGANWIRVSERKDSPWIQIEARPGGKRIKGVLAVAGLPIQKGDKDGRKIAQTVADRTAERTYAAMRQVQEEALAGGTATPSGVQALLEAAASQDMLRAIPRVPVRTHPNQPALSVIKAGDLEDLTANQVPPNRRTFREAFRRAKLGCGYMVATSSQVGAFIEFVDPDKLVASFGNDEYATRLKALQEAKKWSPAHAGKAKSSLGTFLRYVRKDLGWQCGDVPENIVWNEELGKRKGKPRHSEEEYTLLLERGPTVEINLNAGAGLELTAAAAVAYSVAARKTATFSLELENVARGPFPEDGLESPDVFRIGWRPETLKGGVKLHGPHMKYNHILKVTHPREFAVLEQYLVERAAMGLGAGKGLFPRFFEQNDPGGTTADRLWNQFEERCGVEKVAGRGMHGLKRKRVSDCQTYEELQDLAPVAFTDYKTLEDEYHAYRDVLANNAALGSAQRALNGTASITPAGSPAPSKRGARKGA